MAFPNGGSVGVLLWKLVVMFFYSASVHIGFLLRSVKSSVGVL